MMGCEDSDTTEWQGTDPTDTVAGRHWGSTGRAWVEFKVGRGLDPRRAWTDWTREQWGPSDSAALIGAGADGGC